MFSEAEILQTIIGNPKLKWKNSRYIMAFYIIFVTNEQSLNVNMTVMGASPTKMWTFIQTTQQDLTNFISY